MKRYRMFKYWCIVGIVGLQKNACYAQAAPPEFALTSSSTSIGEVCGVRAYSQISISDTDLLTATVCRNPGADPCTTSPMENPSNVYSLKTEAEAVVSALGMTVTSTVSHEIAYSLMDTPNSLLFSGNSIVLHEIRFGGDCQFIIAENPKGRTKWSGDGNADFSIDFSLSKSAVIRLTELHSTMFGRMVGGGVNDEALSNFSWQVIDLSPPQGCSSPCIALQGTLSILGPDERLVGGPTEVSLESGNYRFEAHYIYTPRNALQCVATQSPQEDENLPTSGSGSPCGPDVCKPPSCSNAEIDEWSIELLIVGEDCNGNGIIDSSDIASGFSEDFNLDGVPDECQCPYDIAPVDLFDVCGYGDGVVDDLDFFRLLANWGDCSESGGAGLGYCSEEVCDADGTNCAPLCEGDLNRDGVVNVTDLLKMLGQFGDCQIPPYDPFFVEPFSLIDTCQKPAGNPVDATLDGVSNPTVGAISTTATEIVADDFILDFAAVLTDITWMGYEQVDANCGSAGCGVTVEDEFLITIYGSILHPVKGVPVPDENNIVGQWRNDGGPGDGFMLNRALAGYDESCGAQPLFVYSALLGSMPMLTAGVPYWIEITSLKTDACPWRWSWASQGNNHAAFRSGATYTGEPESSVCLRGDLAFCFNFKWSRPYFFFDKSACYAYFEGFPEVTQDCDGDGTMNWCEVVNEGATDSNGDFVPDCCVTGNCP